jgi:hypothetical protein
VQILRDCNLRYHSVRRRMDSIAAPAQPQEVLLQWREEARAKRVEARRAKRAAGGRENAAAALLRRQRVTPAAVTAARVFELPSARRAREDRAAGALTAAGYPYTTSPHEKRSGWAEMQATLLPSAMHCIAGSVGEAPQVDHAAPFLRLSGAPPAANTQADELVRPLRSNCTCSIQVRLSYT